MRYSSDEITYYRKVQPMGTTRYWSATLDDEFTKEPDYWGRYESLPRIHCYRFRKFLAIAGLCDPKWG